MIYIFILNDLCSLGTSRQLWHELPKQSGAPGSGPLVVLVISGLGLGLAWAWLGLKALAWAWLLRSEGFGFMGHYFAARLDKVAWNSRLNAQDPDYVSIGPG